MWLAAITATTLLVITLGYLAACAVTPTRTCRHCGGTGMVRRSFSRAPVECRACAGNGTHLRAGAWWLATLRHRR
jgi:DnaJ-class molecular chaperone